MASRSSLSEGDIYSYIHVLHDSISKEINCAEPEYMNMSFPTYRAGDATGREWTDT